MAYKARAIKVIQGLLMLCVTVLIDSTQVTGLPRYTWCLRYPPIRSMKYSLHWTSSLQDILLMSSGFHLFQPDPNPKVSCIKFQDQLKVDDKVLA